jgi:alpha-glucosidase
LASFLLIVRNHREFFGTANEPWAYGEEAEAISKTYIGFRYRLMPYMYSAFYEASQTGLPIQRSLSIDYPFDANIYNNIYQYQFLFGNDLLVATLTSKETSKKIYLPAGDWYNIYTDEKMTGPKEFTQEAPTSQLPVYIKVICNYSYAKFGSVNKRETNRYFVPACI